MAGRMVRFATNGSTTSGYLASPAAGMGPGVIVVQEWWGLVPHIKRVCDRLAAEGFTALAPDMYHGQTASEPDAAGKLMMALSIEQAERDLRGATAYLTAHSSTARLGVVGFCMGGQLALLAATVNPVIGACVNFYGIHPNVKPDYARLAGPVLGLFAERDSFVTPSDARALEAAIRAAGGSCEIHVYPGVDHAFFNEERSGIYDPAAAEDAWRRTLVMFRTHLR